MAFTPTTPTTGKIPQPDADQDLDTFHILSVKFSLVPGEPAQTRMEMEWTEGYMDAGTYIPVKTQKGFWDGVNDSDLIASLNSSTTGGTLYNEVKAALWDFLQAKNLIGDGTVS